MADRNTYDWKPGVVLTQLQTAYYAYRAGFRGDDLWKAVAIAGRESGYKPGIHGSDSAQNKVSGDRGLFQINYIHDERLLAEGLIQNKTDLFDPAVNARVAYNLYQRSGNSFHPAWSVGEGGWNGTGDPLTGTARHQDGARIAAAQILANPNVVPTSTTPTVPQNIQDYFDDLDGTLVALPGNNDIMNPFDGITDMASAVIAIVRQLLNPRTWIRILYAIGGLGLIGIGLVTLVGPEAAKLSPVGQLADVSS